MHPDIIMFLKNIQSIICSLEGFVLHYDKQHRINELLLNLFGYWTDKDSIILMPYCHSSPDLRRPLPKLAYNYILLLY